MEKDYARLVNKKNLSGDEVGKAIISHAIALMKSLKTADGEFCAKGLFTDAELNRMVQDLNSSYDISCYNGYREVLNTIRHLLTKLELAMFEYEAAVWKALYIFSNCLQAETSNAMKITAPLMITQEQFEAEKRKALAERDNRLVSYAHIAKRTIEHFRDLYARNPEAENPFKGAFDKLVDIEAGEEKKRRYANAYCVCYCYETPDGKRSDQMTLAEWQAVCGKYEVFTTDFVPSSNKPLEPERVSLGLDEIKKRAYVSDDILALTPFKMIRTVSPLKKGLSAFQSLSLLDDSILEDKDKIADFLNEYKPLVDIAADYMNRSKALKYEVEATVSAMEKEAYAKDLSAARFLGYSSWYDEEPEIFGHLHAGYAVLQGKSRVRPNPFSIYDSFLIVGDGIVAQSIIACTAKIKQSYIRIIAVSCFLSLIAEDVGTPELTEVMSYKINLQPIESLNEIGDSIKRKITRYSEYLHRDSAKTAEALAIFESVFGRICFDGLEPTKEAKAAALELIHDHNDLFNTQERIIAILEEGGHIDEQ